MGTPKNGYVPRPGRLFLSTKGPEWVGTDWKCHPSPIAQSHHIPSPAVTVLIDRESVIPSAGGHNHRGDVHDSLKLVIIHFITRRASELAKGVVSRREDASLRVVDEDHFLGKGSQASERSSTWTRVGWRALLVWPRPIGPWELQPNTQRLLRPLLRDRSYRKPP